MKKTLRSICLSATALLIGGFANAQIQHGGTPNSFTKPGMLRQAEIPVMTMPTFDIDAMLAEDAINEANKIGPWRFGKNFPVSYDIYNTGVWEDLEKGGHVWRIGLESAGAISMNIEFSQYALPKGATVFMYSADRKEVLGSWTHENNKSVGILATAPVGGEKIYIEYYEPEDVRGQGALAIGRVTHDYRGVMGYARRLGEQQAADRGLNDSGSCNNNVICPEADNWRCQIKSVALITVNGNGACTGTLLNNVNQDETPLFLSANHCGNNPSNWVFVFNWDSPTCTPTQNASMNQSVSSASQLVASGNSDFALHQLSSNVPAGYDVYYSGWDATGTMPANQTGIHHPSGDIKKISFDVNGATQATFGGAATWNISNWEDGTTEPGSSGSGLWDQNGRLIGQLYGGSASCSSISDDYYGRLDVSWGLGASAFLDPGNTGTMVMDGHGFGACAGITFNVDASVSSIDNVNDSYCNVQTITPTATVKNSGSDPLTSMNVNYDFNNGTTTGTIPWTGTLAPGATSTVNLPTFTLAAGANSLEVNTSNPNGTTDQNTSNDASTKNFTAVLNGVTIDVDIVIDNYGSETTWTITDPSNTTMASGGPYADGADGTLESSSVCLEEGVCYTFTINDSYGDGICCGFGMGSYNVTQGGTVHASGGEFTSTESTQFCTTPGTVGENILSGFEIYPNPTNGALTVDMTGVDAENLTVTVYNIVGEAVAYKAVNGNGKRIQFDLSNLATGMYVVEINSSNGRAIKKVMLER